MEYNSLDKEDQIGHLKFRLASLEELHYSTSISIELHKRIGDEDSDMCRREVSKLKGIEQVYKELEGLLKELEAEPDATP